MDHLRDFADYFVVLVKGSGEGIDRYVSLLLNEQGVDKVVALMEEGDSRIVDERFEILPAFSEKEIGIVIMASSI
ncbi:hypothetical protein [Parabacteroides sp.]